MARIIPTDDTPGAREAGSIDFLDRYLSRHRLHLRQARRHRVRDAGRQARRRLAAAHRDHARAATSKGVAALDRHGPRQLRRGLRRALRATQQDDVLRALEAAGDRHAGGRRSARYATQLARRRPVEPALQQTSDRGRTRLPAAARHCTPGRASTPTRSTAATTTASAGTVIGFPGPASLHEVHSGRYSTLAYFAEGGARRTGGLTMASKRNPESADVCIIGAGASGAAAAKVLCRARRKVVALEKGPGANGDFRRRRARQHQPLQSLAGSDPQSAHLARTDGRRSPRGAVLPRAADGRRRHGPLAGLAAALHRERLPPAHRRRRPARAPRSPTGRSPMTSSSRTIARSNGRSASPARPAPTTSSRGAPAATRARRCRCRATRRSSCRAAKRSAGTRSRRRRRRCRARSTAARRRWSAPSPSSTATRPARARARSTSSSRMRWRPAASTCGRTATSASSRSTARRQVKARGLPGRRRRHGRAGGRPVHPRLRRGGDGAAHAAVQIRPLPERARQWQRPGRPQRHLPRIQRRGRHLRRSDLCLGRRRLCQRQHLPVLRARRAPRLRLRRPHRRAPASASRCRSTGACPAAPPGAPAAKQIDRDYFNHCWPSPWWSTTCRSTTTASSSTTRSSTPGACRSRGSP